MKYLLTTLTFLIFTSFLSCQGQKEIKPSKTDTPKQSETPPDFDPYFSESISVTSTNGPANITRNILQDKKGNIWLATWEGLIQYDGKNFTNFTNKDSLRRWRVFSLLEDKAGYLWVGTVGAGVYRYNPDDGTFMNYTTKEGLSSDRVGCFYEDQSGKIWIGTEGGISIYDPSVSPNSEKVIFTNHSTQNGLPSSDINSIIEDKDGKIWIGSRGVAYTFDGHNFAPFSNRQGKTFNNVRCIIKDSKNDIWFGGNDGLWRYDGLAYTNYHTNFVGYIYEDSKGNIWTSSETPTDRQRWVLSRYDEKDLHDPSVAPKEILEDRNMFFGILEDKEGGIWLGHLSGACRYNPLALLQPDIDSFDYFRGE